MKVLPRAALQSNAVKLKRRVSLAGIYFTHRYGVRLIFLE
jgi:hypothetical protein